ncbi:hypothetical protein [Proteus mirabilis]|uniref:hypothetical protein n=1 Tax=Proteus mirabilis TaxID=584 RepID=UPI00066817CB|nr:hypothetical protein [Proteus mirabilis]MBG2926799.1 hypothetical protein [Proteus mirabilis]MBG2947629.1 hypothetical protein [Proteus mirabilis]MBI6499088.1 hypothetical protein [Proteus mirabilis]MBO8263387.1 hypothetical protein [Proteus mirabilis]MBO8266758.1 hypothetical protein [Proteus mirabilis]
MWQTLKEDTDLNYRDASRGVSLADLINDGTTSIYQALADNWTIFLAWSSGKDSEVVLHLFLMALWRWHSHQSTSLSFAYRHRH